MRNVRGLQILLCLGLFAGQASANPAKHPVTTPMGAVRELDAMTSQYRVGKLAPADQVFNRNLKSRILRGTFNLEELAKLALDKHWPKRSKKEQINFVELLTRILEERSVLAKEKAEEKGEGKSYEIKYKKEKFLDKEKTRAQVETEVKLRKHRTKFDIDYKLRKANEGKWRIYDVIVEGASLVDNYRFSFGKIIEKQSYAELVRRMEKKLAEFRAKQS